MSAALPSAAMPGQAPGAVDRLQTATVLTVSNCDDSGPGSLRASLVGAANGAVVDMTGLACSTISLSTGALIVQPPADNLTLNGPTDHALTITGNDLGRVLVHNGEGTLTLDHVTVTHGSYTSGYYGGGCIYGYGSVALQHSTVSNCTLNLPSGLWVKGGGIYAKGDLALTDSVVSGNQAIIGDGVLYAYGGGASIKGNLTCTRSSIRDNISAGPSNKSLGGGAFVLGSVQAYGCTISGNQSGHSAGLQIYGSGTFTNSTISGNSSTGTYAGIFIQHTLTLDHCTIAFNTHFQKTFGAGIFTVGNAVVMNSSIIARNASTQNAANYDLAAAPTTSLSGSSNLITASNKTLPFGTISADPMLAPLASNGGATRTHAPLPGSPAIDTGNNVHDLPWDQRGTGHPRVVGVESDIGAFELEADVIFANGFDGFN